MIFFFFGVDFCIANFIDFNYFVYFIIDSSFFVKNDYNYDIFYSYRNI